MAQRGRPTAQVVLSEDEWETLERWARRPKSAQALHCIRTGQPHRLPRSLEGSCRHSIGTGATST
jgi:hypothetical protein